MSLLHTNPQRWGRQGSGALFLAGDRMLLLLRSDAVLEPNTWGIPGGAVEGYDPFESAERESLEETGVNFEGYELLGSVVMKDPEDGFVYTTYVVYGTEFSPELNWESDDYGWFTVDEALELNLHPGVRSLLDYIDPWTLESA